MNLVRLPQTAERAADTPSDMIRLDPSKAIAEGGERWVFQHPRTIPFG
ncbi:hypothetical protein [Rhodovulum steppense]|uniref:Uncharacterized protein n=1 Tax=Rhodovulum steppense TaxID=540251 RepID=A0A4R1YTK5_9RHOB|nr:hypothetical protein [Rhodovulum steppense]TCM84391.1 hypothetical protein EV216_11228 [Rhodovulum steppense]